MADAEHKPTVPMASEVLDLENSTYMISFKVPAALLVLDNFEAMAHDEALAHAHAKGYMPVGPMFISHEECEDMLAVPRPPKEHVEDRQALAQQLFAGMDSKYAAEAIAGFLGEPVDARMTPQVIKQVLVTATMQIGLML